MKPAHLLLKRLGAGALAAAAALFSVAAHAENHALILWIGDYGDPKSDLPGIDLDAANARLIAQAMGVPERNITEISNARLTKDGIRNGLVKLYQTIKDGDKVFIYYSGHGGQVSGHETNAKCSEVLVARDGLVLDAFLQDALTTIGKRASQVVMINDSCFSGGAATKSALPVGGEPGDRAKFITPDAKANTAVTQGYACGDATNTQKITRSLGEMSKDARGPQVLYIAASNDTQVSFATPKGSVGTLAFAHCIGLAQADVDRSGRINGEELRDCAQAYIDRRRTKQTVTLQGNGRLPLSFVKAETAAAPAAAVAPAPVAAPALAPAPATAPVASPNSAPNSAPSAAQVGAAASPAAGQVNAAQALHDLQAGADRSLQVQMALARASLRIGKDLLEFTVNTGREGYLYLLQVGSDGKTFNLLFPNKVDGDNLLAAGTHRFPRPSWRLRSGGPVGKSHLLAIVSPEKKDLSRGMSASSVFSSSSANQSNTRTLVVEATGADNGGSGRYGASQVLTVNETVE